MVTFKPEYQGRRIGRRSVRMKTVKGVSEWIDDEEGSTRLYSVEGYDEDFPSVTTVLQVMDKPWLAPWVSPAVFCIAGSIMYMKIKE